MTAAQSSLSTNLTLTCTCHLVTVRTVVPFDNIHSSSYKNYYLKHSGGVVLLKVCKSLYDCVFMFSLQTLRSRLSVDCFLKCFSFVCVVYFLHLYELKVYSPARPFSFLNSTEPVNAPPLSRLYQPLAATESRV